MSWTRAGSYVTQSVAVAISVVFAATVSADWQSPASLLTDVVPDGHVRRARGAGVVLDNHAARANGGTRQRDRDRHRGLQCRTRVGPAIAGYAIAKLSIAVPFWCCCVGNLALLAALVWWRAPPKAEGNPAGRTPDQRNDGRRAHVRYSREMDATLIRAIAFFPFASAYLALLPLVARSQTGMGPRSMAS